MATAQDPGGIRSQAKQGLEQAREKAGEVAQEAKQRGKERLEKSKNTAADQVEQLASAVEDVAGTLGEQNHSLASLASTLAQRMTQISEALRNRSVEDLAREVQVLAQRNPTAFLVGSVALGVVLSRMLKVSAHHASLGQPDAESRYDYEAGRGAFEADAGSSPSAYTGA